MVTHGSGEGLRGGQDPTRQQEAVKSVGGTGMTRAAFQG